MKRDICRTHWRRWLEDILGEIARHPHLGERLALKGGTAINFVLLSEAPRLSVDIDLNYLGEVGREEMLADRPIVEEALKRIFEAQDYAARERRTYGSTAWTLRYTNIETTPDSVKVEVNWLLRVPIWSAERVLFRTVFPGEPSQVTVLSREEVVAGKLAALLDRAAPRDLFDMAELARHGAMGNADRLRRATILLGSFQTDDLRARLARPHLEGIGERDIRNHLWPTLRRGLRPTFVDLSNEVEPALADILSLTEREERYLEAFYEEGRFDPASLFEGLDANPTLRQHPMAAWRLQRRREGDG